MTIEEAWAAGFLEGDGSFIANKGYFTVKAIQVQREPLDRLQRLLGGSIRWQDRSKEGDSALGDGYWEWRVLGVAAEEFAQRIFPLLSSRRQGQVRVAFAKAQLRPPSTAGSSYFIDGQLVLDASRSS